MNVFGFYDPPVNRWDKLIAYICKLIGHRTETVNGFYHCERCGQCTGEHGEPIGIWNDEDYD